ncbi:uncharacterized protein LOC114244125 [Bombyx mandarina]|uniref:Uncharacterized protein LOC114244125 n=1 Tax=Bombyx mandarina TaxID=7092 RepID=A0A6J2JTU2_BOMMA|nr:uncharacterized protein LOC114244125 [Bombyx mandarina]
MNYRQEIIVFFNSTRTVNKMNEVIFYFLLLSGVGCLRLEQVLIFSRHNIRVPLSKHIDEYTNKIFPKWSKEPGMLTEKGALLEGHMSEYLTKWMTENQLLPGTCPDKETVLIYANNKRRTIATAKAFVDAAFPDCNVNVKYEKDLEKYDVTFNYAIRNTTDCYKRKVLEEIEEMLAKYNLTDAYEELDKIIDIKHSKKCEREGFCDLGHDKNIVIYHAGEKLELNGPLTIGNEVVDNFIMSYYEGRPLEEVAWGEITSPAQWKVLTKITAMDQQIRFNIPSAVKDIARPTIRYMRSIFSNENIKFALLVGHDANLNLITNALGFNSFVLMEQYEPYPVGGKIIFQKWKDAAGDYYLKVEYVYLSWNQLRDGVKINIQNPPLRVTLGIKDCAIDKNGLCPWDDFIKLINKY